MLPEGSDRGGINILYQQCGNQHSGSPFETLYGLQKKKEKKIYPNALQCFYLELQKLFIN